MMETGAHNGFINMGLLNNVEYIGILIKILQNRGNDLYHRLQN